MRQGRYTVRPGRFQRLKAAIHRRWRWFKGLNKKQKAAVIIGAILIVLIAIPALTYLYYAYDISDPNRLMNRNNTGVTLTDKDDKVFYSTGRNNNEELVPLDQISDNVEEALIATEDKDFYENQGFSIRGILGAVYGNFISRDPTAYGGSTITQQLVKIKLLSDNKSFLRKYQEVFLAIAVDNRYDKNQILDMYLNSVYFGENVFGIKEAAKVYFDTTPDKLTLAQSSMLIGILPAPNAYSPIFGEEKYALERQNTVLSRMVEEGYITNDEKAAALGTKLAYSGKTESVETPAPHFAEMVINDLKEKYGEEKVSRSGFQVKTSLDLEWQHAANKIVADQAAINARYGGDNAALIAEDPNTGEIRALVGSSDWNNKEFGKVNMAVTPRQPGSSFKPIYYTEALAQGLITPATHLKDEPINIGGYQPKNFDFRYRGDITIRDALPQSLNIPAVKVMEKVGVEDALDTAERMGISTLDRPASEYGLALALGAGEVKLREMVNAYAAYANGGEQYKSTTVIEVKNKFDKRIYEYKPSDDRVVDRGAAFLISDILSDNKARAPTFGSSLNLSRDTAVKTGSTDNNVDAWTIGYTPNVVVGVWVGNNKHEPMRLGGSGVAGPIWRQMMERAFQDVPQEEFKPPSGVDRIRVCSANGARVIGDGTAGTYEEYFLDSHPPTGTCEREKPKDSDGDGVNDDKDACSNTSRGVDVDSRGCEIVDEPEDSDGDGVNDDEDQCSDTPTGAEVDADGCEIQDDNQLDPDGDGVPAIDDDCLNTPAGEPVDNNGCSDDQNGGNGNGGGQQGVLLPSRRTYS